MKLSVNLKLFIKRIYFKSRHGNPYKEKKNTVTEMRNAFDGPIRRLDTAGEKIYEPEDVSIETQKPKK